MLLRVSSGPLFEPRVNNNDKKKHLFIVSLIITLKSKKNPISKGLCSPCENSRTEKLVAFEADCNYYLYSDDDDDDDDDDSNADDEENNFYDDDDDDEDDENNNSFTSKSLITLF